MTNQKTTRALHPRRLFYGWYIVAASVALNFYLSIVFFQGFQVFFLPISQEFGWSRAATSGAFSLRQLESGLLAPLVGFLVDRWGPRIVILAGVLIGGLGLILVSGINGLWAFYLAFMVTSMGMSGASHGVSWAVAVSMWFRRLRGRALGLAFMGPVVGGPFVVTMALLEEAIGWRTSVLLLGIGLLVVGVPLALIARSRPEEHGYLPDGDPPAPQPGSQPQVARSGSEALPGFSAGQALRTRSFWILSALFGGQFIGLSGLMVHLVALLEDLGYSSTEAASLLGLIFVFSGIGRLGAGVMADTFDRRLVMGGLLVLQVAAVLLLTRIGPAMFLPLGLFALMLGVGFGGTIPLRPTLIVDLFGPRALGAIQGLMQGAAVGAGVFGPVMYGWFFDATGSYEVALYISAAAAAIVAPLALVLRPVPAGSGGPRA